MNSKVDTIIFSDSEYYDFVKSVVGDNYLMIRNETGELIWLYVFV